MAARVDIDLSGIRNIRSAVDRAAVKTMEALYNEVVQAQVMPFSSGESNHMQNNGTFVSEAFRTDDTTLVLLTSDTPYARRLYYHPEYNFYQGKNANAGGEWLKDWIDGDKKDFVKDTFERELGKELKG